MLTTSLICRSLGQASTLQNIHHAVLLSTTNDSWLYMWKALDGWRQHPDSDIYQNLFFGQHLQFLYPPSALLPMLGLHAFGLDTHRALTGINLVFLLCGVAVLASLMRTLALSNGVAKAGSTGDRALWALGVLGALCFYPLLKAFTLGQIQVWLDLAYFTACWCYVRGNPAAAGGLMGFCALVKPQLGLFLLWAMLRRRRRFVAGWLCVVIPAAVLTLTVFKGPWIASYLRELSFLADHGTAFFANQSFNGAALRFVGDPGNLVWSDTEYPAYQPGVAIFTRIAAAAAIALGLLWKWRDPLRYGFNSFVVAGICFTMASPLAWEQHYGILLPGFVLAYVALLARPDPAASGPAMLLAGTYLVCGNLLLPVNATAGTPFNIFQSYLLLGALCLIAQLMWGPAARLATHDRSSGPAPTGT